MTPALVSLGSRAFAYPSRCPCCCAHAPASELAIRYQPSSRLVARDTPRQVLFPYCTACVAHVAIWDAATAAFATIVSGGVVGGLTAGIAFGARYGLAALGIAIAVAVLVASVVQSRAWARTRPSCTTAARAVSYLGWSGTSNLFAFASVRYAAQFAAENDGAAPLPFAALPLPRTAATWLQDLGAQPSRIARRILLGYALRTTGDDDARRAMAEAVARAELRPFFAQLASLSRRTRQQRIDHAITEVRSDNLPDELRDAKLRELTSRSFELG